MSGSGKIGAVRLGDTKEIQISTVSNPGLNNGMEKNRPLVKN